MQRMGMICGVAGLLVSGVALAQAPSSSSAPSGGGSIVSEVQGSYARVKANIVKAAEKMPAEDYSFKPTPDIRTFARVVNHVTEAQMHACGAANHAAASDTQKVPPETADKDTIVAALKASFDECDKAYAALTEANITEMLQAGPAKRSRLGLMWGTVAHDNEQYATLALYMRLKGQVPPSSEK
jgi:DinB superfamily